MNLKYFISLFLIICISLTNCLYGANDFFNFLTTHSTSITKQVYEGGIVTYSIIKDQHIAKITKPAWTNTYIGVHYINTNTGEESHLNMPVDSTIWSTLEDAYQKKEMQKELDLRIKFAHSELKKE